MPVHDWTRVDAGIFHHFHHSWIEEIQRALNAGLLSGDYYALAEQQAAGFGPDVLTLERSRDDEGRRDGNGNRQTATGQDDARSEPTGGGLMLAAPRVALTAETDLQFYRRKQKVVAVRHVSGDRLVAIVEIVSPGNKSSRKGIAAFVAKAAEFLDRGIHLLIVDLHPPGPRDPQGIHSVIWEEVAGEPYTPPAGKPLTLAAYECEFVGGIRTYVRCISVGDELVEMPLFLDRKLHVEVPLERTYLSAFAAVPRRWQEVLAPTAQ